MTKFTSSFLAVTRHVFCFVTVLVFLAASAFSQAQANAADLIGTITDPNGAVVTGATVTARNPATGVTRTATTDDQGNSVDWVVTDTNIDKKIRGLVHQILCLPAFNLN